MTISSGVASKGSGAAVTTQGTAAVTTQATGSAIVGGMIFDAAVNFTSIVDNKGNTFTIIDSEITFNAAGGKARLYYCENAVGGIGHIVTGTTSAASDITMLFQEIPGGQLSGILDQHARRNDTATPFTLLTALTPLQTVELYLSVLAGNSGSNPATMAESGIGATITAQETNGTGFWPAAIATVVQSSLAPQNPSWTQTGGTDCAVFMATFRDRLFPVPLMGGICL